MSLAFRYRAATSRGELVEGVVRASDARLALDELRRRTLVPVSVEPESEGRVTRRRVGRDAAIAVAIRSVATLLEGGAPLDRALEFAASHSQRDDVATAFGAVREDVRGGRSLTQALAARERMFGSFAQAVIRAGEDGGAGRLDGAMKRLADHLDRTLALRLQLRDALLYPALMGLVSAIGVTVLLTVVVPRFSALLADVGGTLPLSTRILVGVGSFLGLWWWALALAIAAGVLATRRMLATPAGRLRWHAWRLSLPVVGPLERAAWTSRFANGLGVLLSTGTPLPASLRVAASAVGNDSLSARLAEAVRAVERGERLAASLQDSLPPLAVQLLAVGEESGTLDVMAARVAEVHDAEVQRGLRSIVSMVEPLFIVCFGALVGFIALAMLQAIYSINASVL